MGELKWYKIQLNCLKVVYKTLNKNLRLRQEHVVTFNDYIDNGI